VPYRQIPGRRRTACAHPNRRTSGLQPSGFILHSFRSSPSPILSPGYRGEGFGRGALAIFRKFMRGPRKCRAVSPRITGASVQASPDYSPLRRGDRREVNGSAGVRSSSKTDGFRALCGAHISIFFLSLRPQRLCGEC
jgi:hypothetical protein